MHHTHNSPLLQRRIRQQALISRPASVSTASPSPPVQPPSNDDIEAVIQMATSARPSPDGRPGGPLKDTRTQLFVGNLPYRVRWQDLKDLFRRAGTVLRADVSLGPDNRSRGYGTVLLATAEDAGRAIDVFNGYSWQTRVLEVRHDRLPPDFENPLGNTTAASVPAFPGSAAGSHSSSYANAVYASNLAMGIPSISDDLDYPSVFGHDHPATTSTACRNLFVGNLPFHCQWQDLKDLFRQAGTIIRADVALGPDGRSRGFGTVVYATDADAERAVKMFNGYEYNGRALKVHYDKFSQANQPAATPISPAHATLQAAISAAASASPALSNASAYTTSTASHPTHITLPIGYQLDFGSPSGPSSPYDMYQMAMQQHQQQQQQHQHHQHHQQLLQQHHHQQQQQQQQQQHQQQQRLQQAHMSQPQHPQQQQQHQRQHSRLQPLLDIDNLTNSLTSTKISNSAISPPSISSLTRPPPPLSASTSSSSHTSSLNAEKPRTSPPHQQHPHHPGPISLPPLPQVTFPISPHTPHYPSVGMSDSPLHHPSMGSPLHHPSYQPPHPHAVPMTPHGLPPITPSMPPFNFLPPNMSPHHHPSQSILSQSAATPNYSYPSNQPHPLNPLPSPGLSQPSSPMHATHHQQHMLNSFSPGVAMSPGTFWGRPGDPNPFINPAVGAPVHVHSPGHGAFFYAMSSPHHGPPLAQEPKGYFDPAYFPPMAASMLGPSGLANEIMKGKSESEVVVVGEDQEKKDLKADSGKLAMNEMVDSSPSDTGMGDTPGSDVRSRSVSTATSWTPSDGGDESEVSASRASDVLKMGNQGLISRAHSLLTQKSAPEVPAPPVRGESDPNTVATSQSSSLGGSVIRSPLSWHSPLEGTPLNLNPQ